MQVYEPEVLAQVELVPHGELEHSFTSAQFLPSALVKPELHAHVYAPAVLVQVEFVPHGVPLVHSFTSVQFLPSALV